MAVPNIYMSWTDVKITYGSGTPTVVAFDETTKLSLEMSDEYEDWRANGGRFARAMPITKSMRKVSIEGGDIVKALGIPRGVALTVTATLKHHVTGTGAGSI